MKDFNLNASRDAMNYSQQFLDIKVTYYQNKAKYPDPVAQPVNSTTPVTTTTTTTTTPTTTTTKPETATDKKKWNDKVVKDANAAIKAATKELTDLQKQDTKDIAALQKEATAAATKATKSKNKDKIDAAN